MLWHMNNLRWYAWFWTVNVIGAVLLWATITTKAQLNLQTQERINYQNSMIEKEKTLERKLDQILRRIDRMEHH